METLAAEHVHAIKFPKGVHCLPMGAKSLSKTTQNPESGSGDQSHDARSDARSNCVDQTAANSQSQQRFSASVQPADLISVSKSALLTEVTRRAMATEFAILLPPQSLDAVELAVTTLEKLDRN